MKHGSGARRHGVFVGAELFEALLNEIVEPGYGLTSGRWPAEFVGVAGMARKLAHDDFDDIFDVRAARHCGNLRRLYALRQFLAIVSVETPLTAGGSAIPIDEDAQPFALLLVEVRHQQSGLTLCKL